MARFLRTDTNSSRGHSRLLPPVVVNKAAAFVARPIQVNQAADLSRRNFRVVARIAKSHLPQVPVVGAGIAFHGPGVRLTTPRSSNDLNRRATTFFVRPAIIPPQQVVYEPIAGFLTKPRDTVPAATSRLAPPTVVTSESGAAFYGPGVVRPRVTNVGRIRYRPKSRLVPPAVVSPILARPIDVTVARIRPVRTRFVLRKPTVVFLAVELSGPETTLAYSLRGRAKSRLLPPAVVTPETTFVATPVEVHLAPSRGGKPKSRLLTVPAAFQPFRPAITHLAYPPTRAKAKPRLVPPAVVAPVLARAIDVTLAPQKRGAPHSILRAPTVVAPVLARPIVVRLARIIPPYVNYVLRRPVDLVDREDLGFVRAHLAYSLRGIPKSILRKPTVVAPVLARPTKVTFVRIRPVATHPILRRPTDLVDSADIGFVRVHLAYSLRGKAKPRLAPPTVVAPILARPITAKVVRITPVAVHSVLRRPVDLVDQQDVGFVRVHLAQIKPVPVRSVLRKPVVIDLTPQTYFLDLHLAYSLQGKPKSFLRPASLFTPQPKAETVVSVTLAYSLRGKPKSVLRRPVVVTPATPYLRPIDVTLAPQRRGKPKPRLAPPVVVARFIARPIQVGLAPQRRGIPKSRLPLVVYAARTYAPIGVHLAPSSRLATRTHSRLSGPTVVRTFVAAPIHVTLVRVAPRPTIHRLLPPAVVTRPFFSREIQQTFVRIRPRRTHWLLRPPVAAATPVATEVFHGPSVTLAPSRRGKPFFFLGDIVYETCYGTVVGIDSAATVCGDTSAPTVTASESAATVSGSTSAATVEGTTSSGGTVTGGDTQREGC